MPSDMRSNPLGKRPVPRAYNFYLVGVPQEPEDVPVEYLEWALGEWEGISEALQEEMEAQIQMKLGRGVSRGKA